MTWIPGPQEIIDTYMDYMPDSKKQDAWQELYAKAIDMNQPETEEQFDILAEAVGDAVTRVLGV